MCWVTHFCLAGDKSKFVTRPCSGIVMRADVDLRGVGGQEEQVLSAVHCPTLPHYQPSARSCTSTQTSPTVSCVKHTPHKIYTQMIRYRMVKRYALPMAFKCGHTVQLPSEWNRHADRRTDCKLL